MRRVRPRRAQGRPYDRSGTSVESRASHPSTGRRKRKSGPREICENPIARIPTIVEATSIDFENLIGNFSARYVFRTTFSLEIKATSGELSRLYRTDAITTLYFHFLH